MADEFSYSTKAGSMPTYTAPEYDWSRVQGLTQEQMYPGMSAYRRGLQSVMGKAYANPMEMSQAYRSAMQGYGEGLGSLQAGATQAAVSLYQPEYDAATSEAESTYQSAYQKWLDEQNKKTAAATTTTGLTTTTPEPTNTVTYMKNSPWLWGTSTQSASGAGLGTASSKSSLSANWWD